MKPANCWGQAAPLLEALEDSGAVGHAYLLLGPANSAKEDAAWLIAQTAICPAGRCGACEDCLQTARHNHPDVHFVSPQSAQGYLVGQIRDLIDDIQLAPIRGKRKVYVLDDAQCLTASSANALLKNLEEPPEDTVFVLLATTSDAVLPTVASRCQTLQFPALSRPTRFSSSPGPAAQSKPNAGASWRSAPILNVRGPFWKATRARRRARAPSRSSARSPVATSWTL